MTVQVSQNEPQKIAKKSLARGAGIAAFQTT
jgi:hypothetical protein